MEEGKFAYWEFVLKGADAHDIHGVQLRETIRRIAADKKIAGDVRNIKENGTVLVRCEDAQTAIDAFYDEILKIQAKDFLISLDTQKSFKRKVTVEPKHDFELPEEFAVIREDELTEMVWALQGAGKIFAAGEKLKERKLVEALKLAVIEISACADEHNQDTPSNRNFIITALENFISTGPVEDADRVKQVYDLYQLCGQANEYLRLGLSGEQKQDRVEELSGRILKLTTSILENLNNQKA